jgi:hypothetical protein
MKIYRGEMSRAQIEAGLAVMKGEFKGTRVMTALSNAGVAHCVPGAQALLARALRLGRVRRITRGRYARC